MARSGGATAPKGVAVLNALAERLYHWLKWKRFQRHRRNLEIRAFVTHDPTWHQIRADNLNFGIWGNGRMWRDLREKDRTAAR